MRLAAGTERTRVLEPGARIGRKLEVLRHLGEGGMGTLWVARNLTTEAEVAIKVLRALGTSGPDTNAEERFRHEARLGAMLAHRNITRVFDLLEDDDGALVLVMELLQGRTLQASCEVTKTLSCKAAVAIMVPILAALQHAHEHGIVHRDLKPSNIFLHVDPDGHLSPKLLDFGIAKMADSSIETRAGDVLGTPSYMSPEQVRASRQLDGRSDLFSVGSVLYEIITGENPFRTDSPSATLARVLELEVDPDPRIEPRVWLEIQRALSKQVYERHASAVDLADALCEAVGEPPPRSFREAPATSVGFALATSLSERRAEGRKEESEPIEEVALPKRLPIAAYAALAVLAIVGLVLLRSVWIGETSATDAAATAPRSPATSIDVPAPSLPSATASSMAADVSPADVPSSNAGARRAPATQRAVTTTAPPSKSAWRRPEPLSAPSPSIARTPGF
jgi:serine/threonine-protein kinase